MAFMLLRSIKTTTPFVTNSKFSELLDQSEYQSIHDYGKGHATYPNTIDFELKLHFRQDKKYWGVNEGRDLLDEPALGEHIEVAHQGVGTRSNNSMATPSRSTADGAAAASAATAGVPMPRMSRRRMELAGGGTWGGGVRAAGS